MHSFPPISPQLGPRRQQAPQSSDGPRDSQPGGHDSGKQPSPPISPQVSAAAGDAPLRQTSRPRVVATSVGGRRKTRFMLWPRGPRPLLAHGCGAD
jgi:hypothetical protein